MAHRAGGTPNPQTPETPPPATTHAGSEHHNGAAAVATLEPTYGQAGGPPGSVAQAKLAGFEAEVELRAVVVAPPGLFNGSMYVADMAGDGVTVGIGANVYLDTRGVPGADRRRLGMAARALELVSRRDGTGACRPHDVWKLSRGHRCARYRYGLISVCESVEGRLVTFTGAVVGWQGDSLLLVDPASGGTACARYGAQQLALEATVCLQR